MDFWALHGNYALLVILGSLLVPRITLWFVFGGPFTFLFWLGWVFCPHITVAFIATTLYWDTNPWLCVFAWIVALSQTSSSETNKESKKTSINLRAFTQGKTVMRKAKEAVHRLTDHERYAAMTEPPSDWKDVNADLGNQRKTPEFFDSLRHNK